MSTSSPAVNSPGQPLPLPRAGDPAFTPSLLRAVLSSPVLDGWIPDADLFSVLLLALIAQHGGVILNVVPEGSAGDVDGDRAKTRVKGRKRVVRAVQAMMQAIFGLSTTYLHLSPSTLPSDIPSLLLDPFAPASRSARHASPSRLTSPLRHSHSLPLSSSGGGGGPRMTPLLPPAQVGLVSASTDALVESTATAEADQAMADILIVTGLESCTAPTRIKLLEIVRERKVWGKRGPVHWGERGMCVWVKGEDDAGLGSQDLPGWVVDPFLASTDVYPSHLDEPPASFAPVDKGIIPPAYIASLNALLPYTHLSPHLLLHKTNLLSALCQHPRLHTTLSARASRAFLLAVRAHRILSGSFHVPQGFEEALRQRHGEEEGRLGLGGGEGGVDTWGTRAGEEPWLKDLHRLPSGAQPLAVGGGGPDEDGQGGVGVTEGWGEEWYALPRDVDAVFELCMRHRVRARAEREEVLWLIKGDSRGRVGDAKGQRQSRARGAAERLKEVDDIFEEILKTV